MFPMIFGFVINATTDQIRLQFVCETAQKESFKKEYKTPTSNTNIYPTRPNWFSIITNVCFVLFYFCGNEHFGPKVEHATEKAEYLCRLIKYD